jgi:formylglycine-generating enzyme required for sulfatase activity
LKPSKSLVAVLVVFSFAAGSVFGLGQVAPRRDAKPDGQTANAVEKKSDSFEPMAIGGKTKSEAKLEKKKFPWLLVGGIAVAAVVVAVLVFKKKETKPNVPTGPTGNIDIESSPAGAKIYRGGADTGLKTPVTLRGVPVGTQTIRLALEGYKDSVQAVEVVEGQTVEIKTTLILNSVIEPEMVYIPGGTFLMGSESGEALPDEKPVHQVTLSGYWIGKYEVTQAEWVSIMGTNPSYYVGDRLPVNNLQWDNCQAYIEKLNAATGKRYRLLTEAEWEYAARAGTTGDRYGDLELVAWYSDNSGATPHEVGGKSPNAFGLYDMLGNIHEWCWDWYGDYTADSQVNPKGPDTPTPGTMHHILRGGSWFLEKIAARAPFRSLHVPEHKHDVLGFRVARD